MIATVNALYKELKQIIPNLPERAQVIKVVIDMTSLQGGSVTIEATYHADLRTGQTVTKRFQLVEMPEE